jgi:hypothetical protein
MIQCRKIEEVFYQEDYEMEKKKWIQSLEDETLEAITGGGNSGMMLITVPVSSLNTEELSYFFMNLCPNPSCREPLKASSDGAVCEHCRRLYIGP